jgi:3-deoxy-D-manno-octulosonate 8-phosphate phosphatase (KDO 8-P phosphatase)
MKKDSRPAVDFSSVRLLLLDVDGVLTPGDVIYDDNGIQIKTFHVRDGLGIRMLMDAGILAGIITGRKSLALVHRCKNLGIDLLYQGVQDKTLVLKEILEKTGVPARETAYIGDDLPDLAVMKKVGIPIAVADSCEEILECAAHITTRKGGQGAVREICEVILKAKGLWLEVIKRFDA